MILSGNDIKNRVAEGDIVIQPFSPDRLGYNSYDLTLHETLYRYKSTDIYRDVKKEYELHPINMTGDGFILSPGKLYLGKTNEYTETHGLVPMIEGVSSVARHGIFIHVTAGFGDIGFCGNWTLEITAIEPVKIYPNMRIAQIYYHTVQGRINRTYGEKGKYQNSREVQGSKLYKEFEQIK